MSLLAKLAASAVKNNFNVANSRTPIYELSIEDARAKVKVRDGNRTPNEDGSQALVLGFGKKTLPLDIIAPKATRVNASAEQVEEYTTILQDAVNAGEFDAEIVRAQLDYEAAAKSAVAPKVVSEQSSESVAPVGVDLSELVG